DRAAIIAEVRQPPLSSSALLDRVEHADLQLDGEPVDGELATACRWRQRGIEHAAGVGLERLARALDLEHAVAVGERLAVEAVEPDAQARDAPLEPEGVALPALYRDVLFRLLGDEDAIAGEKEVRIFACALERGVLRMIPDGAVIGETVIHGD